MHLVQDIPVFGEADEATLTQIQTARWHTWTHGAALMADNHLGYGVPIGGVVAYRDAVSPTGVGYDIGCGNKAVLTDMRGDQLRPYIERIMDDVASTISFGMGRRNAEPVDHPLFDDWRWKLIPAAKLRDRAANQLGTVGSGNHYVDLFTDEQDRVWVGVHFGSRGLGHGIATHYLRLAGASDGMMAEPAVCYLHKDGIGAEYMEAMHLAGQYAYAGRDWVCERVVRGILKAKPVEEVHNHHNYAWREHHRGEDLIVVRKGATPAFPGQRGFVGGSMGDDAVIIEGVDANAIEDTPTSVEAQVEQMGAYFSTVHGAGRVMSRTKARGKVHRKTGVVLSEPAIARTDMREWLHLEGVTLRGADLDEAPQAYKRLPSVLAEHAHTIRILHRLHPVGVAMAGPDIRDPYGD